MARSMREKAYDRARSRAFEDLAQAYPELWEFLVAKRLAEYRTEGHPIAARYGGDVNKVYDKARADARNDLKDLRAGAWGLLLQAWTMHFRDELGVAGEPRTELVRNAEGRFVRAS